MRPLNSVYQVAYVVDDLESAVQRWTQNGGAGPFTAFRHFQFLDAVSASGLEVPDISIALGFSGSTNIELMQVHSRGPCVYNLPGLPKRPFMHHVARLVPDVDAAAVRLAAIGAPVLLRARMEPGSALCYVDTRATLGCLTEFIQVNSQVLGILDAMEQQARDWDGSQPLREFGE